MFRFKNKLLPYKPKRCASANNFQYKSQQAHTIIQYSKIFTTIQYNGYATLTQNYRTIDFSRINYLFDKEKDKQTLLHYDIDQELRILIKTKDFDKVWDFYQSKKTVLNFNRWKVGELSKLFKIFSTSSLSVRTFRTLDLFKYIKSLDLTIHSVYYDSLMLCYASTKRFEECWILLQQQTQLSKRPTIFQYRLIFSHLATTRKTLVLAKLYKSLIQSDLIQHEILGEMMVDCFIERGDYDNALVHFNDLKNIGVNVPTRSYKKMMLFMVRFKKINYARQIFNQWLTSIATIQHQDHQPNQIHSKQTIGLSNNSIFNEFYELMIKGYSKDQAYSSALELYSQFLHFGGQPNPALSRQIVKVYLANNNLESGLKLMRQTNLLEDIELISLVRFHIEALIDLSYLDGLNKAFPELLKNSNNGLASSLIQAHIKEGKINEARKLLDKTIAENSDTQGHYHCLMNGYFNAKQYDDGMDLIHLMNKRDLPFDSRTYECIFKLLTKKINLETVQYFYETMREQDVLPTLDSFKYVMHILIKLDQPDMVQQVFLDVIEIETFPTSSLINIVMLEYINQHQFTSIIELFETLHQTGAIPQLSNFGYLVDNLVKNQQFELVEKVLLLMQKVQVKPDCKMMTLIIQGYVKAGTLDRAQQVLDLMSTLNISPDNVTFTIMVKGLIQAGKMGQAKQLFLSMPKYNLTPDLINYSTLISTSLIKTGISDAIQFLNQLESLGLELDGVVHCLLMSAIQSRLGPTEVVLYFNKLLPNLYLFPEPLKLVVETSALYEPAAHALLPLIPTLKNYNIQLNQYHLHLLIVGAIKFNLLEQLIELKDDLPSQASSMTIDFLNEKLSAITANTNHLAKKDENSLMFLLDHFNEPEDGQQYYQF